MAWLCRGDAVYNTRLHWWLKEDVLEVGKGFRSVERTEADLREFRQRFPRDSLLIPEPAKRLFGCNTDNRSHGIDLNSDLANFPCHSKACSCRYPSVFQP